MPPRPRRREAEARTRSVMRAVAPVGTFPVAAAKGGLTGSDTRVEAQRRAAPSTSQATVIQAPEALRGMAMVRKTTARARWMAEASSVCGRRVRPR